MHTPNATRLFGGPCTHLVVMDKFLLYHLHGIDLVILLQPHQEDLGIAPTPDDSDEVEVLQPQPLRDFDPIYPVDDRLKVLGRPERAGGTIGQNSRTVHPHTEGSHAYSSAWSQASCSSTQSHLTLVRITRAKTVDF